MSSRLTRERLEGVLGRFSGRRLVVAGDFVLDRFIYGHPKRVSREAPVLILRFSKEENLPGGAGNTAANVRALGGVPVPVGILGDDGEGRILRAILEDRGIDTSGLVDASGYATPTKTRILGGAPHAIKQQIVRYDREGVLEPDSPAPAALLRRLPVLASGAHAAILSDYGYGAVSPAAVGPLRESLSPGAPVLVDSRHALSRYADVDAVTPNEEEIEECVGFTLGDSEDALARAGEALRRKIACRTILVTRGSRGMALFSEGAPPSIIPVHGTDQVADVTGAGDTVLATFSLALAAGATPLEAAVLANFAGGVVVMKMGTATVTREEISRAMEEDRGILES
ncbi:MAG: PfkB family carbohydrate kinase [Acidobacteria bacterium]|nr:PfkB family carbohydrate kinase [Acidobacteriota bacterium]MCA1611774.1 PfkB family carbohydrate kinase [Acidobacteriota bacterium]MCA1617429.1 PfkB family carbohydrate kinase [Acidobacteriota bacterium]